MCLELMHIDHASSMLACFGAGVVGSFVSIAALTHSTPINTTSTATTAAVTPTLSTVALTTVINNNNNNNVNTNTPMHNCNIIQIPQQSFARKAAFGSLAVSFGLVLTPLSVIVEPHVVPMAILLAMASSGAASFYAYGKPAEALLPWSGALLGGLSGIVVLGLASLGALFIFGPNNAFSTIWTQIDAYAGIALFSALVAHDTHVAIKRFERGDLDVIGCATDFYLDFVNLLTRFVVLLAKNSKKQ